MPESILPRKAWVAWVTLGAGLIISIFGSLQVRQAIVDHAIEDFALTCNQVTLKIQERLDAFALVLRGGSALFAASNQVERKEWQAFVGNLHAERSIPGVQGIGFAELIPPDRLAAHIARVRKEGFPDYTVRPPGNRAVYTSILYLEPFRDRNLRAFGYDMFSEPVGRAAMEQARDTGDAALSGKVKLVQETDTDIQAGALMFVPVYRNGAVVDTVAQRRAALIGWVFSPYRMNDLMAGILGDWESQAGRIVDLQIYDGGEAKPANLLFDSKLACTPDARSVFYQQRRIDFNGRQWLLEFDRTPSAPAIDYAPAWMALAGGLLLSGLLFWLMRSIINTRADAVRIADKLTVSIRQRGEALQESEAKIRLLLDSTAEAIFGIDMNGNCNFCNDACLRLLGYRHIDGLRGKNMHRLIHGKYADGRCYPIEECRIFRAFKKGERMHADDEVLWRADGSFFPAEYWAYPQIHQGAVVGAVVTFLDITERKQAVSELRQISARLSLAVRAGGIGVWDYDMVNNILVWDDRMLAIFGMENMEFGETYEAWLEGIHPVDRDREDVEIQRAIRGEKEFDTEFRVLWLDGSIHHVRSIAVVQRDQSGKPERMIGTNWDITEIRNGEQAKLEDSENRYHSIFQGSPDGILIANSETKMIILANPAICAMFGYSREQFKVMNILQLHPLDILPNILATFNKQACGESALAQNIKCISKNGSIFFADINSSPVVINGKNHLVGFFRDITERKRTDDKLARHEAEMRATLYSIGDAVVSLDINGCVSLMNPVAEQLTGWSEAEARGRPLEEIFVIINEETRAKLENPASLILTGVEKKGVACNTRLIARDGTERSIGDSAAPILDQNNAVSGVVLVFRDLTKEKELQEKLLSSEKLAVMGRLVADVSHELNNPLAIVIGRTELILSHIDEQSAPFKAKLEIVLQSARRCKTILSNLLTYSKTIGKKEGAVNLPDLIEEAVDAVNYEYDMSGVEVSVNCNLPTDTAISGNKDALLSVFINLIRNACRAMDKKGNLTFTIAMQNECQLRIEIHDTGIGISKEKVRNIFQPFSSGWGQGDGTGLGLATSRGIIETHGGEMWVESEGEGKGTTFTILLPYKVKPARVEEIKQTVNLTSNYP